MYEKSLEVIRGEKEILTKKWDVNKNEDRIKAIQLHN